MFNEICINEEMLPKYTYIYIYIYPGSERPACLATLKSSDRTKQSVCGWLYIYIYIYIYSQECNI